MSAVVEQQRSRAGHGGMPARAAVVRWAWRMMRREARHQVLLLGLIVCTTAASVCALAAAHAYQVKAEGTFGAARAVIHLAGGDGDRTRNDLRGQVAAVTAHLTPAQVVAHRSVPVPGALDGLDVRAQDPRGALGAPRLRLRDGRWPAAGSATEIALSGPAAEEFHAHVGGTVRLGGQHLTVTGLAENPARLSDAFALAVPPAGAALDVAGKPATTADVLTGASDDAIQTLRQTVFAQSSLAVQRRGNAESGSSDVLILALATVALLLVALVSAAAFAVVAHRRMRQIGMLAAIGATGRQLRLVLVAHGALTGAAGAAAGAALGLAAWVPLAPHLENSAGHRIGLLTLPWAALAALLAAAVLGPTAAAWWPGRAAARIPVAQALSARPPRPARGRDSVWAAAVLLAAGATCLILSDRTDGLLVMLGIVGVVGAFLLMSPLVVRAMAGRAAHLPFTARLVLRDLGRHQARSGAALAAVTLAIGVPVAVSVLAAINQHGAATGNLPARDVLLSAERKGSIVPGIGAADARSRQDAVIRYATTLGGTATPLLMAYDPALPATATPDGTPGRMVLEAGRQTGSNSWRAITLYVATPDAVRAFGLRPADLARGDLLTRLPGSGSLAVVGAADRTVAATTVRVAGGSAYSSVPSTFVTPDSVRAHGWRTLTAGWLVTAPHDLTAAQRSAARDTAAANGMTEETRDRQDGLRTVRWASVAAGAGLALAVLAMTVGAVRAESAEDVRTLTATGAGSRTRRGLTATTAGSLALAGTVLGTAGAYAVLLCAFAGDPGTLRHVPYLPLLVGLPGIPLLAAASGWLLAGEPGGLSRRRLE